MALLGLSKVWLITIFVAVITGVTGAGVIVVIAITVFIFGSGSPAPATPIVIKTATAKPSPTVIKTKTPLPGGKPSLSFQGDELRGSLFCQGAYKAQGRLANHGDGVAANVIVGWEIVKGANWVDSVSVSPGHFAQIPGHGSANYSVEVRVKNSWWQQPNGTEIKVRLFIANEDNRPGHHQTQAHVTIVKKGQPSNIGACITITPTATLTPTATITPSATITPTGVPTGAPGIPPFGNILVLKFKTILNVPVICQGSYQTQQILVNAGGAPVDDAAVVWDIVEGADLVETVNILSPHVVQSAGAPAVPAANVSATAPAITNFTNLTTIAGHEEVKLDIKVKVNDKWWKQPDGTKIKVKLSIKHKLELHHDDDDDDDDDSIGSPGGSQTIVIVKQGAQWVTIKGRLHPHGNQKFLIDGRIVVINSCTGFPPQLPPGSDVEIIAIILPDGTISVINIIIVNVNVVVIDLDSGVPTGGSSGGSDGGSGGGGKGGGKGGSKGGGSKGGSKGGSGGSKGGS